MTRNAQFHPSKIPVYFPINTFTPSPMKNLIFSPTTSPIKNKPSIAAPELVTLNCSFTHVLQAHSANHETTCIYHFIINNLAPIHLRQTKTLIKYQKD